MNKSVADSDRLLFPSWAWAVLLGDSALPSADVASLGKGRNPPPWSPNEAGTETANWEQPEWCRDRSERHWARVCVPAVFNAWVRCPPGAGRSPHAASAARRLALAVLHACPPLPVWASVCVTENALRNSKNASLYSHFQCITRASLSEPRRGRHPADFDSKISDWFFSPLDFSQ